ncbi:hypothetical protein CWO90_25380 [Bradyrhizobium sp. Leo121]|nr:hypothetical protein CWO90_25380 [Bradyrhizobium sp. Leo121]
MFHSENPDSVGWVLDDGPTDTRIALGTISESARLVYGTIKGTVAMRIKYLAAIAIAVLAACTGLAVISLGPLPPEKQSTPTATQMADRLAQSFDPFFDAASG